MITQKVFGWALGLGTVGGAGTAGTFYSREIKEGVSGIVSIFNRDGLNKKVKYTIKATNQPRQELVCEGKSGNYTFLDLQQGTDSGSTPKPKARLMCGYGNDSSKFLKESIEIDVSSTKLTCVKQESSITLGHQTFSCSVSGKTITLRPDPKDNPKSVNVNW
ncbi:hypothetical protein MHLP_01560 [Candidatus Mycoplasma haematolamae str. Purdue]|uniref:Ig-like domain-containing protein n=1 Tax=Mycoplasma haematolamae (strain Purdue) TaxID=1212765 RepID=I7C5V0_MYCHA|nr:hypothetical protein [Candidatus Mycoplasma haematolamae]AFO51892.1 hypothetical protein MHLP_01560 [Candidatus Mycoplasma haematolamae str. Purdue]